MPVDKIVSIDRKKAYMQWGIHRVQHAPNPLASKTGLSNTLLFFPDTH